MAGLSVSQQRAGQSWGLRCTCAARCILKHVITYSHRHLAVTSAPAFSSGDVAGEVLIAGELQTPCFGSMMPMLDAEGHLRCQLHV